MMDDGARVSQLAWDQVQRDLGGIQSDVQTLFHRFDGIERKQDTVLSEISGMRIEMTGVVEQVRSSKNGGGVPRWLKIVIPVALTVSGMVGACGGELLRSVRAWM